MEMFVGSIMTHEKEALIYECKVKYPVRIEP